jgi:hypothetical protein
VEEESIEGHLLAVHEPPKLYGDSDLDTDDEDDIPEVRKKRHLRKYGNSNGNGGRRGEMKKLAEERCSSSFLKDGYSSGSSDPDEMSDEEFVRWFFIRHCNIMSKKWLQRSQTFNPRVRRAVLAGEILTGPDSAYQVDTGQHYAAGMARLMVGIQTIERQAARSGGEEFSPLIDNRIHYRNFFLFNSSKWIKPSNVIPLIMKEDSAAVRRHMLNGFQLFLEHVENFAETPKGINKFIPDMSSNFTEDMSVKEKESLIVKSRKKGEKERREFLTELICLRNNLKNKHYHKIFNAESEGVRKRREEIGPVMFGKKLPDPNVPIPRFLSHGNIKVLEILCFKIAMKEV